MWKSGFSEDTNLQYYAFKIAIPTLQNSNSFSILFQKLVKQVEFLLIHWNYLISKRYFILPLFWFTYFSTFLVQVMPNKWAGWNKRADNFLNKNNKTRDTLHLNGKNLLTKSTCDFDGGLDTIDHFLFCPEFFLAHNSYGCGAIYNSFEYKVKKVVKMVAEFSTKLALT